MLSTGSAEEEKKFRETPVRGVSLHFHGAVLGYAPRRRERAVGGPLFSFPACVASRCGERLGSERRRAARDRDRALVADRQDTDGSASNERARSRARRPRSMVGGCDE